jgi:hypothetical protein
MRIYPNKSDSGLRVYPKIVKGYLENSSKTDKLQLDVTE